ncbi:hypothetical protein SVIOM342S_06400 [Streptomyces violaceorubidus]
MRDQLRRGGVAESVIDDAVLVLSELLSNACKHGRPLGDALAGHGDVRAAWQVDADGRLLVEVTDGGGPTRPVPATPSVTAHGGRGLNIITALADDWGVRDDARGEVTVWVVVHDDVHDPDAWGTGATTSPPGSRPRRCRIFLWPGLRGRLRGPGLHPHHDLLGSGGGLPVQWRAGADPVADSLRSGDGPPPTR